ncbi:hypothetical protein [Marivita sp. XM-24bin2]|uniref:hypothetical protein n=1 Tax=unclassified Marivita TaxID=2632480 RepID=UPI000D7906C9|nr:hypothetical protein [Marivita sp. XM-24bin2]MCR9110076.1 hypothetical protein [Paracoccaceae bacterium]PWL33231.1 MAG: hypothetical protein DCO97_20655 [Marivita sp. XM-24bin2]
MPLVAALAFGASPELIGLLVACQISAHLIGSNPFGIVVDQGRLRALAVTSAAISLIGFGLVMISVLLGLVALFGVSITLAGLGVVLFDLTSLSIVPRLCQVMSAAGMANFNCRKVSAEALDSRMNPFIVWIPAAREGAAQSE